MPDSGSPPSHITHDTRSPPTMATDTKLCASTAAWRQIDDHVDLLHLQRFQMFRISPLAVAELILWPIFRAIRVLAGGPLAKDPAEVTGQGFYLPR